MVRKLVGSLGVVGDMLKDLVKRKHRADIWMDKSFLDSLLHQSSQTKIAWPSRNRRDSRAKKKSSSGTVKEVSKEVTQAKSRRVAFICNKVEKVEKVLITGKTGNKVSLNIHSVSSLLDQVASARGLG